MHTKAVCGDEAAHVFWSGILEPIPLLDETEPIPGMSDADLAECDHAFVVLQFQLGHLKTTVKELTGILLELGFCTDNLVLLDWLDGSIDIWKEDWGDHGDNQSWPFSAIAAALKLLAKDVNKHLARRLFEAMWDKCVDPDFHVAFKQMGLFMREWELPEPVLQWTCNKFFTDDNHIEPTHRSTMIDFVLGKHVHIENLPVPGELAHAHDMPPGSAFMWGGWGHQSDDDFDEDDLDDDGWDDEDSEGSDDDSHDDSDMDTDEDDWKTNQSID